MVRALFLAGHSTVVLDACNNTQKRRDMWASCKEWHTEWFFVKTTARICIERARAARDYEIVPVIERMDREQREESA